MGREEWADVRRVGVVVLSAVVLASAACGEVPDLEELTAEPLAEPLEQGDDGPDEEPSDPDIETSAGAVEEEPDADPEPPADGDGPPAEGSEEVEAPEEPDDGPRPSDAVRYVEETLGDGVVEYDVLLLDGSDEADLLLAHVDADGEAHVEAARWRDEGFEPLDRVAAGRADTVGTLRTPRLPVEGQAVALGLRHEATLRIAVWDLTGDGLAVPARCPVDEPRELRGQGSKGVTLVCDPADAGDAEGPLAWDGDAFTAPPAEAARSQPPQRDADDPDDRVGAASVERGAGAARRGAPGGSVSAERDREPPPHARGRAGDGPGSSRAQGQAPDGR